MIKGALCFMKTTNKNPKIYPVFWGREGARQLKTFLMMIVESSEEKT